MVFKHNKLLEILWLLFGHGSEIWYNQVLKCWWSAPAGEALFPIRYCVRHRDITQSDSHMADLKQEIKGKEEEENSVHETDYVFNQREINKDEGKTAAGRLLS